MFILSFLFHILLAFDFTPFLISGNWQKIYIQYIRGVFQFWRKNVFLSSWFENLTLVHLFETFQALVLTFDRIPMSFFVNGLYPPTPALSPQWQTLLLHAPDPTRFSQFWGPPQLNVQLSNLERLEKVPFGHSQITCFTDALQSIFPNCGENDVRDDQIYHLHERGTACGASVIGYTSSVSAFLTRQHFCFD